MRSLLTLALFASVSVFAQTTHQSHAEKGDILREKRDFKGAEAEYREALWFDKKNAAAFLGLGMVAHFKGDFKTAITQYRESLAVLGDQPEARLFLADALLESEAIEPAIVEYKTATLKLKGVAQLHNNYGVALASKGEMKTALAEFRQAAALTKTGAEADLSKAPPTCVPSLFVPHFNLAAAEAKSGDAEISLVEYTKAAAAGATREGYVRLARAMRAAGALETASANFARALQVAEGPCVAEAASTPKRFLVNDKQTTSLTDIYFYFAQTLQERSDLPRALLHYQKALALIGTEKGTQVSEATLKQRVQTLKDRLEPKSKSDEPAAGEPAMKAPGFVWYATRVTQYKETEVPHGCSRTFGSNVSLDMSVNGPRCVQKLGSSAEVTAKFDAIAETNRRLPLSTPKRKEKNLAALMATKVGADDCPKEWSYSLAYSDSKQEVLERSCWRAIDKAKICSEGVYEATSKTCVRHQCEDAAEDTGDTGVSGCIKCPAGVFDSKQTMSWLRREGGGRKAVGLVLCRVSVPN